MQPNNPQRPTPPAGSRPQFFDVVRPGRTPASPNSRPVLPNNQPAVPDTSMRMGAPAVPSGLLRQQQAAPPATVVAAPARPTFQPQPAVAPAAVSTPPVSLAAPVPVVPPVVAVQQVGPTPIQPQQPSAPVTTPEPEIPKQPESAHHQKHSFWSEFLAIFAIVLLVGVIFNILLDAEIIDLPVPHTNFFDY